MNAAVRSAVRSGLSRGHKVYGVNDGFLGLADGLVRMRFITLIHTGALQPGEDLRGNCCATCVSAGV